MGKDKKEDENLDLFKEAKKNNPNVSEMVKAAMSIQKQIVEQQPIKATLEDKALTVIEAKSQWEQLKEDLDGKHLERFNKALAALPDREYVRVFLKMLEFTKPKLARVAAPGDGNQDNTININILSINDNKEYKYIDITEEDEQQES